MVMLRVGVTVRARSLVDILKFFFGSLIW